ISVIAAAVLALALTACENRETRRAYGRNARPYTSSTTRPTEQYPTTGTTGDVGTSSGTTITNPDIDRNIGGVNESDRTGNVSGSQSSTGSSSSETQVP